MYDHRVEQSGTGMIVTLMKDELFDHNDEYAPISTRRFIKLYYSLIDLTIIIIINNLSVRHRVLREKFSFRAVRMEVDP